MRHILIAALLFLLAAPVRPEPIPAAIPEPGAAIEGRVTDLRGTPVQGARVVISEGSSARKPTAVDEPLLTGPNGFFRVSDLEGGQRFDLAVRKEGYLWASLSGVEAPTKEPLHIELRPARSLSIRVLDAGRRPVRDARIWRIELWERGTGDGAVNHVTHREGGADDQGRFVLSELEPGPLHLKVEAPGFRAAELYGLRIPEDGEAPPLEVVLAQAAVLKGRVLDANGRPSRAEVSVFPPDARVWEERVSTDGLGSYRIDGLEPGEYRVEAWDASRRAEGKVVLGDSGTRHLDLQLPPGVDVSGRIVDEQGKPVQGAALLLSPRGRQRTPTARSAADGSFRFRNIPEGTYTLVSLAPGYVNPEASREVHVASQEVSGLLLRLAARGEEAVFDLEMQRGLALSGRVLVDGQPLAGARVRATGSPEPESHRPPEAVTRYDGSFVLAGLHPGRVTLSVTSRGIHHLRHVDLAADQTITIEIPTGQISGHVLSSTGKPVEGALIALQGADRAPDRWFQAVQALTDDRGAVKVSRLSAGSYRITVTREGFAPATQTVEVTPGGTTEVQVVLKVEEGVGAESP